MKPYYEAGGIRIFHGDAREVLPSLGERFGAVITDPVWPDVRIVRLTGFEEALALFTSVATLAAALSDRLVVYLSRETDPRFLAGVPASMPFLCACWLRFIVPRPGQVARQVVRGVQRPRSVLRLRHAPPRRPGARHPSRWRRDRGSLLRGRGQPALSTAAVRTRRCLVSPEAIRFLRYWKGLTFDPEARVKLEKAFKRFLQAERGRAVGNVVAAFKVPLVGILHAEREASR